MDTHSVIVVGNKDSDPSSKPEQDYLQITTHKCPWKKYELIYSPSNYGKIVEQPELFSFGYTKQT